MERTTEPKARWVALPAWVTGLATLGIFVATVAACLIYREQTGTMKDQLRTMQQTLALAQKPVLKMHLHEDPDKLSTAAYVQTDEGGERWKLYYWVLNIGDNPGFNMRYWHTLSYDSSLELPDTGGYECRWSDDLLFPAQVIECGFDQLLRQKWLDDDKNGLTTHRHMALYYEDERGNPYGYYAVWRIIYQQGRPLHFALVSYRPMKPQELRALSAA